MRHINAKIDRNESKPRKIRITVTLTEDAYEKIKHVSLRMGLLPASWVSMVATSRVNNIELPIVKEEG